MDIVPKNKPEAQIEIESVFATTPMPEALENPFISLGDGSSSSPNLRAVEMIMTALFVNRYQGAVVTNFYHGASFRESADKIGLWLRDMEFDFKVDRDLLELHYIPYFGDPQLRIDNMVSRMRGKGKSEEEIQARVRSFESVLPVSVFSANGLSFIDYIKAVRQNTTVQVMEQLGLAPNGEFRVEIASEGFVDKELSLERNIKSKLCLNDILTAEDEELFKDFYIMKIACPECSLSNTDGMAEHSVSFSGDVYQKSEGSEQNGSLANNCKNIAALRVNLNGRSLLDVPIPDLINMGFNFAGKMLFLMETRLSQNPNVTQAIRAYTRPHGTIAKAAEEFEGLTVLTPSIYINIDDSSTKTGVRDATIFELLDFMSTQEGLARVKEFTENIPLLFDGLERKLNISNGMIVVKPMITKVNLTEP